MAALMLTILGAGPAAPNPGGACSGYLVRQDDAVVLIDCGPGVAGRLALHVPAQRLSGVAISHLHPDHYFDLVQLYYLLRFGEPRPAGLSRRLAVHVPPGGRQFLSRFGELIGGRPAMLEDVLDICDYAEEQTFDIGGLPFSFHPVQHYIPSHAMRVRGADGKTFVFSSDAGPCDELREVARAADLFLCESALVNADQDEPDPVRRGHMSAAEAGAIAQQAGAKRLLITHYRSSDGLDARHLAAARTAFAGRVELAREGASYTVD